MSKKKIKQASVSKNGVEKGYHFCNLPDFPEPQYDANVTPARLEAIRSIGQQWVNGTVLHYYFFDQPTDGQRVTFSDGSQGWRTWTTSEAELDIVRKAFDVWASLDIGLVFEEVDSRSEAEIRIGRPLVG